MYSSAQYAAIAIAKVAMPFLSSLTLKKFFWCGRLATADDGPRGYEYVPFFPVQLCYSFF